MTFIYLPTYYKRGDRENIQDEGEVVSKVG